MSGAVSTFSSMPIKTRKYMFFYKKIRSLAKRKGWTKNSKEANFSVTFSTLNFGYDLEVFDILKRFYQMIGWKLVLMYYQTKPNHEGYEYTFDLQKLI